MANTLKFGNGEWYGKKDTILAYNDENSNFKPLPFSFERDTTATRVNKAGLIETVGSGEPRIDYKDDSKGALLLEPSRSNAITNSEAFDNAYWTKTNTTVTSGFLSPDGTNNAFKLISNNGGNIIARPSISLNTNHATSIYLKRVSGNGNVSIFKTNGNEQIITLTDEWQRFTDINSVNPSNAYMGVRLYGLNDEILIYGAQVEQGSYATSYIPTQGSAVTRVAESCNNGGNEQVINSTEGVLYAEISALANDGEQGRISLSNKSLNNRVSFAYSPTESKAYIIVKLNSTTIINNLNVEIGNHLDTKKIAISYKSGDTKVYLNGVEILTSSVSFTGGVLNDLSFTSATNSLPLYAKTKDLRIYNTALSNAELQALTT